MGLGKDEHVAFSNAIETGNLDLVHSFLDQYPELVNHSDWTPPPLHCAILWNQLKVVDLLLENGADIEMLDPDQQTTPLRYAIMFCKTDVIPTLISRGADTGPIVDSGKSAFQLAQGALAGEYEDFEDLPRPDEYQAVVDMLLQAGVDQ